MQRDAESHASEDKKKRELVKAQNTAEQRVYQLEKMLEEHKDKLGDSDKTALRAAIDKVNEAKKSDDVAAINRAVDELSRASQAMSEHLYSAGDREPEPAPPGPGAGPRPSASPNGGDGSQKPEDVIDVEFEEKKRSPAGKPSHDRGSVLLGRLRPTGKRLAPGEGPVPFFCTEMPFDCASGLFGTRGAPIFAKARGFPALTFPRREDSESRASYEAALHATLARSLLIEADSGAPCGVSWRPFENRGSRGSVFGR